MPDVGRILRFPIRRDSALSVEQAEQLALGYLSTPTDRRSNEGSDPEVLSAICKLLRGRRDSEPKTVADEAVCLYWDIRESSQPVGVFDERDYFLGETAFLAG